VMGGGTITPDVRKHVVKAQSTKAVMGGGVITPAVRAHLAKAC